MRFILLFLCFQASFAQTPILSVVIDEIQLENHQSGEIKYEVFYHITNNSSNEIRFFFDPKGFGQSLSSKKIFALFENDQRFNGVEFLQQNTKADQDKSKADFEKMINGGYRTPMFKELGIDIDEFKKESKEGTFKTRQLERATVRYKKDVVTFKPLETKKFQQTLFWQKNRYYTEGDYEFYLNEKSKFELQFTLILLKDALANNISKEYLEEISNDKNFIKGVFYSNKMIIEFKD